MALFHSNVLAPPLAQAGFWEERRQAVQGFTPSTPPPAPTPPLGPPFPDPSITGNRRGFSTLSPRVRARGTPIPAWLLEAIGPYGEVREISLTPSRGAAPQRLIILLQDAHEVLEAQTNLARILQQLIEQQDITLIGLEGAHGPFNLEPFRSFSHREAAKDVADDLLRRAYISGPEYVGITSPKRPLLWGVDDPAHYVTNVQAFKTTLPEEPPALAAHAALVKTLDTLKPQLYSPELAAFDAKSHAYHAGTLSLGDYVTWLGPHQIDQEALFRELSQWETAHFEALATTPEQRLLITLTRQAALLKKLFQHSLTPEEWTAYQRERESIRHLPQHLAILLGSDVKVQRFTGLKPETLLDFLDPFERFYRAADARNHALLTNLLAKMDELRTSSPSPSMGEGGVRVKQGIAVLVAGGFHTPVLQTLLRNRQINYVTVTPKLTKIEDGTHYLDVFTRTRTPLEQLLLGEKLFVNPERPLILKGHEMIPDLAVNGDLVRRFGVLRLIVSLVFRKISLKAIQEELDQLHSAGKLSDTVSIAIQKREAQDPEFVTVALTLNTQRLVLLATQGQHLFQKAQVHWAALKAHLGVTKWQFADAVQDYLVEQHLIQTAIVPARPSLQEHLHIRFAHVKSQVTTLAIGLKRKGLAGVWIPTNATIHSNRAPIQDVIQKKDYHVRAITPQTFSYDPSYTFNAVFEVDEPTTKQLPALDALGALWGAERLATLVCTPLATMGGLVLGVLLLITFHPSNLLRRERVHTLAFSARLPRFTLHNLVRTSLRPPVQKSVSPLRPPLLLITQTTQPIRRTLKNFSPAVLSWRPAVCLFLSVAIPVVWVAMLGFTSSESLQLLNQLSGLSDAFPIVFGNLGSSDTTRPSDIGRRVDIHQALQEFVAVLNALGTLYETDANRTVQLQAMKTWATAVEDAWTKAFQKDAKPPALTKLLDLFKKPAENLTKANRDRLKEIEEMISGSSVSEHWKEQLLQVLQRQTLLVSQGSVLWRMMELPASKWIVGAMVLLCDTQGNELRLAIVRTHTPRQAKIGIDPALRVKAAYRWRRLLMVCRILHEIDHVWASPRNGFPHWVDGALHEGRTELRVSRYVTDFLKHSQSPFANELRTWLTLHLFPRCFPASALKDPPTRLIRFLLEKFGPYSNERQAAKALLGYPGAPSLFDPEEEIMKALESQWPSLPLARALGDFLPPGRSYLDPREVFRIAFEPASSRVHSIVHELQFVGSWFDRELEHIDIEQMIRARENVRSPKKVKQILEAVGRTIYDQKLLYTWAEELEALPEEGGVDPVKVMRQKVRADVERLVQQEFSDMKSKRSSHISLPPMLDFSIAQMMGAL
ncbi:MAG: hypothetical protein HYZ73_07065, partial [Elusimicrobia bacterium]|nr:hypothetical protein [Elusimicrobiota bacterium]